MLPRFITALHPRSQPWMSRQSYAHEMITSAAMPVAVGLVEGSVVGVLARKTFEVGPVQFATIMAAPMFANVTSFFWAHLARGRKKIPFITGLQVLMLAMIGLIAALPTTPMGGKLLVVLILAARCAVCGIVTIRSTIWRLNYPRHVRARITGKLSLISSLVIAVAPLAGYALLDHDPLAFRWVYPASLIIASVGVVAFSRVRLRGERQLLKYEADPAAAPRPHGETAPIYEYDARSSPDGFWSVLRRDHLFRRYMKWQFVGGMCNMMGDVLVVYVIVELTRGMANEYLVSILMTTAIPVTIATATLPLWARYMDRVHIVRLRSRISYIWVLQELLNWIGAVYGLLGVVALSRCVRGCVQGAGMLAWNLGHNDFADRRLVALYMGIHVTLTGVRGALGPFLAMLLYAGWSGHGPRSIGLPVAAWGGIGGHAFMVTAALGLAALVGFHRMDRQMRRPGNLGAPEAGSR